MFCSLAKANTGIEPELIYPSPMRFFCLHLEPRFNLCHNVIVVRVLLHGLRGALGVHRNPTHTGVTSTAGQGPRNVIHQCRTGVNARFSHCPLGRINTDSTQCAQRSHHRQDPSEFCRFIDWGRSRSSGLSPNVNNVGTLFKKELASFNGNVRFLCPSSGKKGVRGDVDDAHNQGSADWCHERQASESEPWLEMSAIMDELQGFTSGRHVAAKDPSHR